MTNAPEGPRGDPSLPPLAALWLPLGFLLLLFAVGFAAPDFYRRYFETEFGLVENLTALLALLAALTGLAALRDARRAGANAEAFWLLAFTVACVLFLGEELSWGQHFAGWSAGGVFAERGQDETNLHNLHPFVSRASRAVVVSAVVIAGVILPLSGLGRYLAARLPGGEAFWLWALPAKACALTAALTLLVKLPKRLLRWLGLEDAYWPDINDNEMIELFVAHFMLIYALLLYRRLKARL